ncbi:ABC transporter ATP-binding protein [Gordonia aichiensis]|uniref:Putative ABC transporter permease/ATP-binding protein n=1 Tax=Gordonia aichiensis NBRC 108223 TaxID=1220583 RepID=L7KI34_9ACTN|nr:putative ABC transporter permease/ATP-binding protein [Gordonia aichiensis NBRC 108223]
MTDSLTDSPAATQERGAPVPVTPSRREPVGWIRRLAAECWRHRRLVVVTLAVTLVAVGVDLVAPLLAKAAIDHATGAVHGGPTIATIVGALLVLAVVRYACQFGRRLTAGQLSISVQNAIRLRLMRTLLHLDGAAQSRISTGQVVSRSISDLQIVQGLLAVVPLSAGAAVQVVIAIGIMTYLSPLLTVVALSIIPVVGVVVFTTRRKLFAATWSAQQSAANVAQHVEETVTGVRVVKGFGQESRAVDKLVGLARDLYSKRLRAARINARFSPTMAAIPQLGMVAVIALGGWLTLRGSITAGTFLAFATYVATMTSLARLLTNLVVSAQLARAAVDRVYDVIDEPTDPGDRQTGRVSNGPLGLRLSDVGYAFGDKSVLRDVDLDIAPGECVAVVGPPGSGKSTLAELTSRYLVPTTGAVSLVSTDGAHNIADLSPDELHAALSVVFDEPFLYSDTIAANIALGAPVEARTLPDGTPDPRLVDAATRADALEFISALPDGFDTVVGERGLTLSGGQRQRVALARALYAAPRVLVLDDATSAVDAATESRILRDLRSGGSWGSAPDTPDTPNRPDRPTMLVLAHRRSTLMLADRVAVLDDGSITDIGTVADLDARNPRFRALMTGVVPETASVRTSTRDETPPLTPDAAPQIDDELMARLWPPDDADQAAASLTTAPSAAAPAAPGRPGGRGGGMASALGSMQATPQLLRAVEALPPADEDPRVDTAAVRREDRRFSLWGILSPVRLLLATAIICISIDTLIELAFPSLARAVLDAAGRADETRIWEVAGFGVALVVLGWIVGAVMTLTSTRAGERVLLGLRVRSYAHLQRLGLDYYERELSGRIMTRMTTDVDALSTFLQTGLTSAIVAVLTLVGVTVALLLTDIELGLIILPVFPILIAATVAFRRVAADAYTRSRELVSVVNADFQENIAGIRTTQTYRSSDVAMARFTDRTLEWVRARMRSQRAISVYFPFITLMSDVAAAVAIAVGAHRISTGTMQAGTLVAFILYLSLLFGPVQQLSQVFDGYQQAVVGLRRIADLLRTPSSLTSRTERKPVPARGFRGDADLNEVSFRYAGAQTDALSEVNLTIPAGSSLALVGRTGAGKSTVVKLLARFYDPTSGEVRMDATDIRDFGLLDYRHRIGLVPQEAHLFTGSVADNIAYGRPDADPAQITAAALAVGATDVIAGLDGGMRHEVGERGGGLSSGQRQLIALARAELVDPDLLLLDEATATLDQATEALVLAAGETVTRRRTSVIVAHRLATAARADRIAVVDNGRIVESGTHDELLSLGGRYRAFWDAGVDPDADGIEPA